MLVLIAVVKNNFLYFHYILAQIVVEFFLRKNLFLLGFAERPTEAPAKANKKRFMNKKMKRKAGNSFKKNYRFRFGKK